MGQPLEILLLGAGKMGMLHLQSAVAAKEAGTPMNISVVERDEARRAAAAAMPGVGKVNAFSSLEQALESMEGRGAAPKVVVAAFNDDQHYPALKTLHERVPGNWALFSEKPLTDSAERDREVAGWLKDRFVSLNTIIHFSPVFGQFDRLRQDGELLEGAQFKGFEAVWQKNRTEDKRPTIGIKSDLVHPLGIITDMLEQKGILLIGGSAVKGPLTAPTGAADVTPLIGLRAVRDAMTASTQDSVIYAIPWSQWLTWEKCPVRLRADYGVPTMAQERRVVAFLAKGDKTYAAEFNFDRKQEDGRTADTLHVYQIGKDGAATRFFAYRADDKDIDVGLSAGAGAVPDKAKAFFGRSLEKLLTPARGGKLSGLEAGLMLGDAINSVNEKKLDTWEARAVDRLYDIETGHASPELLPDARFGTSIASSTPQNLRDRVTVARPIAELIHLEGSRPAKPPQSGFGI